MGLGEGGRQKGSITGFTIGVALLQCMALF